LEFETHSVVSAPLAFEFEFEGFLGLPDLFELPVELLDEQLVLLLDLSEFL
jgi:hypothetical protein